VVFWSLLAALLVTGVVVGAVFGVTCLVRHCKGAKVGNGMRMEAEEVGLGSVFN
jgi:hypothetical protein